MYSKYSEEYVKNFLLNKNISLCSKYEKTEQKIKLECLIDNCKHKWESTFHNLRISKIGCPKCANTLKYTLDFVNNVLLSKNIKLLSAYNGCQSKLELLCLVDGCGYMWVNNFSNIYNKNQGCRKCNGLPLPYKLDFVLETLKNKNIKLLSEYKNSHYHILVRCLNNNCNYEWKTLFKIIVGGSNCPKCANVVRHTYEYVKKIIENKNITLLTKEYNNAHQKLQLLCNSCQYRWSTNFNRLYSADCGCPSCSGVAKHNIDFVKKYLYNVNIKLLDSSYKNCNSNLNYQCIICGCKWITSFDSIKNGKHGCPLCNKHKNEKLTYKYLQELGFDFNYQFKITLNESSIKRIIVDFYLEFMGKKCIIEYNGIQHYEQRKFFHKTNNDFLKQQLRDQKLIDYCEYNGIKLIIIDGRKYKEEKILDYLKVKLNEVFKY